jgi:hypothetical protein
MTNPQSSNELQTRDRIDRMMRNEEIVKFITKNSTVEPRAREAAEWLVSECPGASEDEMIRTLLRVLPSLARGNLKVFFSYKAKDKQIATQIASWLEEWSAGRLQMQHMGLFGVEQVGRNWRRKIEEVIPQCDWFLLLLPSPGEEADERDWVLFEAGYFFRGEGLAGRLVCLHHPDNQVVDALGAHQSVPAETEKVKDFLEGLFHQRDWIPGMPALNSGLRELEVKAKGIVNLIQRPASLCVRAWSAPHMEVAFDDPTAVKGWEQLARGHVIDSNDECRRIFGLQVPKEFFGDWVKKVEGAGQDKGWVIELADAVQAAGEGRQIPAVRTTISLGERRFVRPTICAVRRRKGEQRLEAMDILFSETEPPFETSFMSPDLAALAITLQYAVRFRYQILERYVGRQLVGKDVLAFNKAMTLLVRETARDPRFAKDPLLIRKLTLASFTGEDKDVVQKMYDRADQLWREDGEGEMDRAIANLDAEALARFIQELGDMNRSFLTVTSKRFAELLAGR